MNRAKRREIERIVTDLTSGPVQPTGMFVGFNWGDSWLSKRIQATTRGPSHALVGFEFKNKEPEYYEALIAKGVEGPKPYRKVKEWFLESPDTRNIDMIRLDGISPESLKTKRAIAQTYVGTAGYAEMQLLAMLMFERHGWRVPKSTNRVVCSELVARILVPEIDLTSEQRSFDEITPGYLYDALKTHTLRRMS